MSKMHAGLCVSIHIQYAPRQHSLHFLTLLCTPVTRLPPPHFSQARHILITNWPVSGVPQLMESFSLFTPAGSQITFVLPEEAPATWPSRLGSCRFSFVTTDNPTSVKVRQRRRVENLSTVGRQRVLSSCTAHTRQLFHSGQAIYYNAHNGLCQPLSAGGLSCMWPPAALCCLDRCCWMPASRAWMLSCWAVGLWAMSWRMTRVSLQPSCRCSADTHSTMTAARLLQRGLLMCMHLRCAESGGLNFVELYKASCVSFTTSSMLLTCPSLHAVWAWCAQVQDAVMASKRKDAPHLVAPIRRYATSKVGETLFPICLVGLW